MAKPENLILAREIWNDVRNIGVKQDPFLTEQVALLLDEKDRKCEALCAFACTGHATGWETVKESKFWIRKVEQLEREIERLKSPISPEQGEVFESAKNNRILPRFFMWLAKRLQ